MTAIIPNHHTHLRLVAFWVDQERRTYWREAIPIIGWHVPELTKRQKEQGFEYLPSAVPVSFDSPGERWVIHNRKTGRAVLPDVGRWLSLDEAADELLPAGLTLDTTESD